MCWNRGKAERPWGAGADFKVNHRAAHPVSHLQKSQSEAGRLQSRCGWLNRTWADSAKMAQSSIGAKIDGGWIGLSDSFGAEDSWQSVRHRADDALTLVKRN
jgi:hypothetical protein